MSQSLSKVLIHLIFSTKEREPWIHPSLDKALQQYLSGTLNGIGCTAIEVGGTSDHVHLFFALSRTSAIAEVVEKVKTASSKWVKTQETGLSTFRWQNGYGAFSVGQSSIQRTVRYLANQREHHRRRTFQDEYRMFLHRYQIDFDEKYLWD